MKTYGKGHAHKGRNRKEDTQNPRPGGKARVAIPAETLRNRSRLYWGCVAVPDVGGGLPQPEPARTTGAQAGSEFASKGQIWLELAVSFNIGNDKEFTPQGQSQGRDFYRDFV